MGTAQRREIALSAKDPGRVGRKNKAEGGSGGEAGSGIPRGNLGAYRGLIVPRPRAGGESQKKKRGG